MSFKVGSFAKATGAAPVQQVVAHGLGSAPTALILYATPLTATGISVGASIAFGITDGTTSRCVSGFSDSDVGTSDTGKYLGTELITILDPQALAIIAQANLVSIDATNFTLNWTTNDANAYIIHFVAIGGNVNAKVVEWNNKGSTGLKSVTGVGFQPDFLMHLNGRSTAYGLGATQHITFGFMNNAAQQTTLGFYSGSGGTDTVVNQLDYTTRGFMGLTSGVGDEERAVLSSMDADGFTLNYENAESLSQYKIFTLCLQNVTTKIGTFTKDATNVDGAVQAVTGVGFQPDLLMIFGVNGPSGTVDARLTFGASDGVTQGVAAMSDKGGLTSSESDKATSTSKIKIGMDVGTETPIIEDQASLTSLDANGFTLTWDTNSTFAEDVYYVAFLQPNTAPNAPTNLTRTSTAPYSEGQPRFSWTFSDNDAGDSQSALQVYIESWNGSAWVLHHDTGKVVSTNQYYDLPYANKLAANTLYRWKVKTWDQSDAAGAYTTAQEWTTPKAYYATGTYTSKVFNPNRGSSPNSGTLSWTASTPTDTTLAAEYRTSADNVTWGAWTSVTNGGAVPAANYVQVRFNFTTAYGLATAELRDFTLAYPIEYYTSANWISPVIDASAVIEAWQSLLSWSELYAPAGTDITVDYRTSADNVTWGAWTAITSGQSPTWNNYVQLRVSFTSTDGLDRAILSSITLDYDTAYKNTGTWVGPAFDLRSVVAGAATAAWVVTLNGGTISVETRYSKDAANWSAWVAIAASGNPIVTLDHYIQARITVNRAAGGGATPTVDQLTLTVPATARRGTWNSPSIDISQALSKTTGKLVNSLVLNGGTITDYYRYSTDNGVTWTQWYEPLADGTLSQVTSSATHVQLMLDLTDADPEVTDSTVSFDGTPAATELLTGLGSNAEYDATTINDIHILVNGVDPPKKYDGVTTVNLGGSPPVMTMVVTHLNRVWGVEMENPSRVRYSGIKAPESWGALDFIDFNPDDGDSISSLFRFGDMLVTSKVRSVAVITGDRSVNFAVTWLEHELGATGFRAVEAVDNLLVYVSRDGIRSSDLSRSRRLTEKLLPTWLDTINHRRLNQAAVISWQHYLLVALPGTGSLYNDRVWVLDTLRNAWSIIPGWSVSRWLKFKQYGEEILLAGDSGTGQVYRVMVDGGYDDTTPITLTWQSKEFDMGYPERFKLFPNCAISVRGISESCTLAVTFIIAGSIDENGDIVDTKTEHSASSITVPAGDGETHLYRILPPTVGAVLGRTLAIRVVTRAAVQSIVLDFSIKGMVPGGLA